MKLEYQLMMNIFINGDEYIHKAEILVGALFLNTLCYECLNVDSART